MSEQQIQKLTEKQEGFAQDYVLRGMTKADAYRNNYDCSKMAEQTVWSNCVALAKNPQVALRIQELIQQRRDALDTEIDMSVKKLLAEYIAIKNVDPNELTQVRSFCCRHCYGEGNLYQWREHEYLRACDQAEKAGQPLPDIAGGFGFKQAQPPNPECDECQGSGVTRVVALDTTRLSAGAKLLYRGAQQTKDGIKVLFADKDKALDQIGRMLGAFNDKLGINLGGAVATLQLTTDDPAEAAKIYQQMLTGKAE